MQALAEKFQNKEAPQKKELSVFCEGIAKSYGTGGEIVKALQGVNLEIETGELCMIVGPSGCGKTTLISVVAGILNQDSGSCKVLGVDIKSLKNSQKVAFRAKNIGFVFQSFNLLPTLNAAENVAVPLIINGVKFDEAVKKSKEFLERVGLGSRYKSLPSQLSGGQQQRVAIARALVHNPKVIVCDEPTSALDHETGGKVMDLMKELAMSDSRTLIIVTHDERIFKYADRIAKMDDGKVIKMVKNKDDL